MGFEENYRTIYEPVKNDIQKLKESLKETFKDFGKLECSVVDYINSHSKHIRAVMSFLFLHSIGITPDKNQIEYQVIIELIHNASLIHDDIIDGSEIRRGKLPLNLSIGNRLAVIAGDWILAAALKKVEKYKSAEILNIFSNILYNMCSGEVQQEYSRNKIPTIEEYLDKTYKKTGALFEGALRGACVIAKYEEKDNAALFAKNIGIAFQIRDDIKNIMKNGDDIKNGIYTAPIIYSASVENPISGIEKATGLLDNYLQSAKHLLKNIPESEYKLALIDLVELLKHE